jgi:hypothetical protein
MREMEEGMVQQPMQSKVKAEGPWVKKGEGTDKDCQAQASEGK